MLFDLEDYYITGGIGQYNRPPYTTPYSDKEDYFQTYFETRNAFYKALNEWFLASTLPSSAYTYTCTVNPHTYYNGEFQDAKINMGVKQAAFYYMYNGSLMPPSGNFENLTEEVFNDYVTAFQEFMCALKKLIKITVGGDFEDVANVPEFNFVPTLY